MKHILNNISEEEKNAIREQHSGGMKIELGKFKQMVETKLGDPKPYLTEQSNIKKGLTPEEIESLNNVLSYLNPKGKAGMWNQDNTKRLSVTIQLSPNDKIANLGGFNINKPLSWSLYDSNGKKVEGALFNIFKSEGVIMYSIFDGKSFMRSDVPLKGNERGAVEDFNRVVRLNNLSK